MMTRFHALTNSACVLGLFILSGCTMYQPEPPDLQSDVRAWQEISQSIAPSGKKTYLSWGDIAILGLYLNPDLNKSRLKFLSNKRSAQYAGLWDDPSLSLSGNRYLSSLTYDRSVSLGLSIPVSGRTTLARKVSELYAAADYCELQAQEQDYLTRLRTLCYLIQITHTKLTLIQHRLKQAQDEKESISQLQEMGEVAAVDMHTATQRCNDLMKELQELENAHLDKHLELISMLGLHPSVGDLEIIEDLPSGVPSGIPIPTESKLLQHPRMKTAMGAYNITEAELQLEIRKQYPDISLSPGFTHEEGEDKIGLDIGFTLPLWNRNREAIARAQGARAMSRLDAMTQYRELLQQAQGLARKQDLARKHCTAEFERLNTLQDATEQQERLYQLGEVSLPTLAESRHETYTRRLAYLDCLAELLEIRVALLSLSQPDPS